jgi:hypothetical protein
LDKVNRIKETSEIYRFRNLADHHIGIIGDIADENIYKN